MSPSPYVLDAEALNLKGIRDALKQSHPDKDRAVYFLKTTARAIPSTLMARSSSRLGLDGLGRQAGFGRVTSFDRIGFDKWDEWVAPLKNESGADAQEKAVGRQEAPSFSRADTPELGV